MDSPSDMIHLLEALLTHFVIQSEPEILRLRCKWYKVCEWEEKFLKELQGIREPMLDLDHTYQFFKRTISGKLLLCLDKGALTPKSFAKIVCLIQSISIFKINSCLKTNLSETEE